MTTDERLLLRPVEAAEQLADAVRFARSVEVDKDRGLFTDPALARTPLAEVASAWLDSNPGKRDGSWQRDEIVVRRHIVPALGSRAIGSLTPADIQGTVNRWVAQVSPGTVRRQYGVLRAIVNYAMANDMLGRSPCRRIELPEVTPVKRHIVSADELAELAERWEAWALTDRWCTSTSRPGRWLLRRRWSVAAGARWRSGSRSRRPVGGRWPYPSAWPECCASTSGRVG